MLEFLAEADRCLQCKTPLCRTGCPVNTDIPGVIRLLREEKLNEAARKLFDNNPLALICAIVCDHGRQCEGRCDLGRQARPLDWGNVERVIADTCLGRLTFPKEPPSGRQAAIIGSGPAGLTAAIELAKKGHEVTIFEQESKLGGMLRYGIPEFRLPRSVLDRYTALLKKIGVHLRLHTSIGTTLTIADLFRDGFDAVFIASGLWRASPLNIPGESLPSVCYGIHYLASPESFELGNRLAIIGTGNTAIDVARTALHRGVEHVTLYARRAQSAADPREVELARLEGARFRDGMQVVRITKEGPVFRRSRLDEAGQILGLEEDELLEPADFTIIAASQSPRALLIHTTEGLEGSEKGLIKVDENGSTTVPGIFAAGDVVHGGRTVVQAVAGAKAAADAMDRYLCQLPAPQEPTV